MTKPDGVKRFPIMRQSRYEKPHPIAIPWSVAEAAYSIYRNRHGDEQSLERLGERGGFGPGEMDDMLPDWRERCAVVDREVAAIKSDYDRLTEEVGRLREALKLAASELGVIIAISPDFDGEDEDGERHELHQCLMSAQRVANRARHDVNKALTKGDCDE